MRQCRSIWLLVGPKGGDNAQVRALGYRVASLTGAELTEIPLRYRPWELLLHLRSAPTLVGLAEGRQALVAPWPDLVITAGRRNELVAGWLGAQTRAAPRLVFVGRPWSRLAAFDLVVATPQYQLAGPNVLQNRLPLVADQTERLAAGHDEWRTRFEHLPAPRIGLLLGGDSGYYLFTPADGAALGQRLNALAGTLGGSLLISSSRRTPRGFVDALQGALTAPHFLYRWRPGDAANPYLAILGLADALVVTSESMSMIAEATATGTPTYLAPVTEPGGRWWRHASQYRWRALSHRFVQTFAPMRFRREVTRVHAALLAAGIVGTLDDLAAGRPPVARGAARSATAAELQLTGEKVAALFGDQGSAR